MGFLGKKLGSSYEHLVGFFAFLSGILILGIMLLVSVRLVSKQFFARPMPGVIEIAEYALLFMTFLGTAWLVKRGAHVKIDTVLDRLNSTTRAVLNIITSIIVALTCLVITWYGVRVTWEHFQSGYFMSTPLRPPSYLIMFIIPVGSFLLAVEFLRLGYGYLRSIKTRPDE